jgi:hypothetical protein
LFQAIGLQRKQAFYLREAMGLLFPYLYNASKKTLSAISGKDDTLGVLQLGLQICELYGITGIYFELGYVIFACSFILS